MSRTRFALIVTLILGFSFSFGSDVALTVVDETTDAVWPKTKILIENQSDVPQDLYKVRVHYVVSPLEQAQATVFSPSNLSVMVVQQIDGSGYAEIDMQGATIAAGGSYNWGNGISLGLHLTSWASWSSSINPPVVTLHDAFGNLISGDEPVVQSLPSSSDDEPVLEIQVVEESYESNWIKPRIQIKNISSSPVSLGEIVWVVKGRENEQPLAQVFDPSNTQYSWEATNEGTWALHLYAPATLDPNEVFNWGNGISFGIHHSDWTAWDRSQDPGLAAVFDQNSNALEGAWVSVSSSSQEPSSSSQFFSSSAVSSSSTLVSSVAVSSSSSQPLSSVMVSSSSSQPQSSSVVVSSSSEIISSSSSEESSSSVEDRSSSSVEVSSSSVREWDEPVLAEWPFPVREDTVVELVVPEAEGDLQNLSMIDRYGFLFDPENGVQRGVTGSEFSDGNAIIVRGRVFDGDGNVLVGAKVFIADHPEWGHTRSREDGQYDMMIGRDTGLVVQIQKADYLPAQRNLLVLAESDFSIVQDVMLVELSPVAWTVELSQVSSLAPLPAEVIEDVDGSRQSMLLIPAGLQATFQSASGDVDLSTITVRQTEYTIGTNGPARMPASLPEASAYTYAIDFTVDEALLYGGGNIVFNKPIPNYTDNFIGLPVGTIVPVGSYSYDQKKWIAELDGIVLEIVSIENGVAYLDVDGDGAHDNWNGKLTLLGVSQSELEWLATTYGPGKTLWRTVVSHFTPYDYNHPYLPEASAEVPPIPDETPSTEPDVPGEEGDPCQTGSAIDVFGCSVAESWRIPGSNLSLIHASANARGYAPARSWEIDLKPSGRDVTPRGIILEVTVAGNTERINLPGDTRSYKYVWDGEDAYGRAIYGYEKAFAAIYYEWDLDYAATPAIFESAWNNSMFGQAVDAGTTQLVSSTRGDLKCTLVNRDNKWLYAGGQSSVGLSGWTLSGHETMYLNKRQVRRDALGHAKALPVVANFETVVKQAPEVVGNLLTTRITPEWFSGGLGNKLVVIDNGTYAWELSPEGGVFKWQFSSVLGTPYSHILGMDGVEYYLFDAHLRQKQGNTLTPWANPGLANNMYAVNADGVPTWIRSGLLYRKVGSSYNGYSSSVIQGVQTGAQINDIAVSPDGIIWLATDAGLYKNSGWSSNVFSLHSSVANGGSFTSVASDLNGRIFAALMDDSGSRIVAITSKGSQVNLAGGGNDSPVETWNAGTNISFTGELKVRANAEGMLIWSETNATIMHGGWVDSIPTGEFQEPGSGILDSSSYKVLTLDSMGRHAFTISALTGDTILGFEYDTLNRIISIREGKEGNLLLDWSVSGEVGLVSPKGYQSTIYLNDSGLSVQFERTSDGASYVAEYEEGGLLKSWQNPVGAVTEFEYDSLGRLMVDHNARGGSKTILLGDDPDTLSAIVQTAMGIQTLYQRYIDSNSMWTRKTISSYGGESWTKTSMDGLNSVVFSEDSMLINKNISEYVNQGMHRRVVTTAFLPSGDSISGVVSLEEIWGVEDSLPIVIQIMDTIERNGVISTSIFDRQTGIKKMVSAEGRESWVGYDSLGRKLFSWIPKTDTVFFDYDTSGLLIHAGHRGRETTFEYDESRRVKAIVNALGQRKELVYDDVGRTSRTILPNAEEIGFQYDLTDRVINLTLPSGSEHSFVYDSMGDDSVWVAPFVAGENEYKEIRIRDLDGRIVSKQLPDGSVTVLNRFADGRVQNRISANDTVAWEWVGESKRPFRITRNDVLGNKNALSYAWDGSRLKAVEATGLMPSVLSFNYDENWRRSNITINGTSIPYSYDTDGLITQAGMMNISRETETGRIIGAMIDQIQTTHEYNGSQVNVVDALYGGESYLRFEYGYDPASRIKTISETDRNGNTVLKEYSYDALGQLLQVKENGSLVESYAWDSQNNRVGGYYNARDQLISMGSTNYEWDGNGALKVQTGLSGTRTYKYDSRSNLLGATLEDGTNVEYYIDGLDRRIGKSVNGVIVEGFVYKDRNNPIAWLNGDGSTKATFVYADRINVPSYMIMNGQKYRFVVDHLGSIRMVVNSESGIIMQEIAYDAFGNEKFNTNPGFQPFGFAGGITDVHTGLVRFGARDYDPTIGRWTSVDPIRFRSLQGNLYVYVGNNPINFIDPTGLQKVYLVIYGAEFSDPEILEPWRNLLWERYGDDFSIEYPSSAEGMLSLVNTGDLMAIIAHGAEGGIAMDALGSEYISLIQLINVDKGDQRVFVGGCNVKDAVESTGVGEFIDTPLHTEEDGTIFADDALEQGALWLLGDYYDPGVI